MGASRGVCCQVGCLCNASTATSLHILCAPSFGSVNSFLPLLSPRGSVCVSDQQSSASSSSQPRVSPEKGHRPTTMLLAPHSPWLLVLHSFICQTLDQMARNHHFGGMMHIINWPSIPGSHCITKHHFFFRRSYPVLMHLLHSRGAPCS